MDLKDIKAIIDLMKKNDLSVFEMEKDGFRLKLQKGAGEQTVFTSAPAPAAPGASALAAGMKVVAITNSYPAAKLRSAHRVVDSLEGLTAEGLKSLFAG